MNIQIDTTEIPEVDLKKEGFTPDALEFIAYAMRHNLQILAIHTTLPEQWIHISHEDAMDFCHYTKLKIKPWKPRDNKPEWTSWDEIKKDDMVSWNQMTAKCLGIFKKNDGGVHYVLQFEGQDTIQILPAHGKEIRKLYS